MDVLDFSRIFFALIAVLALIGVLAAIARKAGFVSGAISMARRRRLSVVESIPVDARRRAVILRCDGREHLIMLGPTHETVIDGDIPEAPAQPVEPAAEAPGFAATLHRLERFSAARNPFAGRKNADAA